MSVADGSSRHRVMRHASHTFTCHKLRVASAAWRRLADDGLGGRCGVLELEVVEAPVRARFAGAATLTLLALVDARLLAAAASARRCFAAACSR